MARRSVGRVCASLGDSGDDATAASKKAFDDVLKKGSTEVGLPAGTRNGMLNGKGHDWCIAWTRRGSLRLAPFGSGANEGNFILILKPSPNSTEDSM